MDSEEKIATQLSNKMAKFVLKKGKKEEDSVWYRMEITDMTGSSLSLRAADIDGHGANLRKILHGGNPGDYLRVQLVLNQRKGFAVDTEWSLPIRTLTYLRAYPDLVNLTYLSYREFEGCYTYFPLLDQPKSEILRAHQLYNALLEKISVFIGNPQSPKPSISSHSLILFQNNS